MDDVTTEDISREYIKMQRDIVSGRLICSKEEAANLAAVQLRLEAWPEENLDLAEGECDYWIIFSKRSKASFSKRRRAERVESIVERWIRQWNYSHKCIFRFSFDEFVVA